MTEGDPTRAAASFAGPAPTFLSGQGEMAELIRRFDWASSPLGALEQWPQSLRSAVSILLPSKAQIALFWGPDLLVLYNDAYRPAFGAKHPWALGRPARECWSEVWEVIRPLFEGVMQTGEAFRAQDHPFYLERHGYPEETYFDVSYDPVRVETGEVGGLFCIVSETTGRVLGERRLRILRELGGRATPESAEATLQAAAEVLATDPADVPYALLYLLEGDARLRLCAVTGAAPRDSVRQGDLDDGAAWTAPFAEAARTGRPVEAAAALLCASLPPTAHPDRLLVYPIVSGTALAGFMVVGPSRHLAITDAYRDFFHLVAGRISAAVGVARAIEEERRRAEALAELDRAKTAFFSNVSHEFRTPLTLMLGPLQELLLDGRSPVPAPRAQLDLVHRNALRLLKLVNSLLDFARIEAGRAEAVYEPTDLAAFTAELAGVFRSAIERAGLRYLVDCPPLPEPVYVDRDMWEKIVLNLLSNAFKFTFDGHIAVRLGWGGDHALLEVTDTGVGIPAEAQSSLFRRFHRIQGTRARTHEGTGIGLALVQELARMQGGAVQVESQPGRGSTFGVRIPAGTAHLPPERIGTRRALVSTAVSAAAYVDEALRWLPDDEALPSGPPPADPSGAVPARILVVEDNADLRDYLRRILGARWEVETAADGAAALARAQAEPPDLVLTDVMMPGLDGFQLLRGLRRDPRTRDVLIVMLSARAGEEARIEGLDAGADDYLVKPFSARELVARVSAQLSQGAVRRAAVEHQARLYELFMQAPVPICVLRGTDLVYEMANALYQQVVGRRELIGRPVLDAFPELLGQGIDELLQGVIRTGAPYVGRETPVRLDRRGDGVLEETYWTFICAPLRRSDGATDRVMVLSTEVTDQVLARREIESARAAAEAASRAKDEFLAMLGHELRNPLAAIGSAIQVMGRDGLPTTEADLLAGIISRQTAHLSRLVNDLLDVAGIQAGKVALRRGAVDLAEVANRCLTVLRETGRLDGRRLEIRTAPVVVEGDPARLEQILTNLVDNALKYTAPEGRLEIRVGPEGGAAVILVRDEGAGISREHLASIFEPFVQAHASIDRGRGGLGLGLALVRRLVELHGGQVAARSEGPGRGSEFEVRLPILRRPAAPPGPPPASAPGVSRRRVLIVEDHADTRQALRLLLEAWGHAVEEAADGRDGLEKLLALRPDLALVDVGLPGLDGYAVARAARQSTDCPKTLLVALTGYGLPADRQRALDAGFHAHLVKPVEEGALAEVLARARPERTAAAQEISLVDGRGGSVEAPG